MTRRGFLRGSEVDDYDALFGNENASLAPRSDFIGATANRSAQSGQCHSFRRALLTGRAGSSHTGQCWPFWLTTGTSKCGRDVLVLWHG
jgi:hypothetical protein